MVEPHQTGPDTGSSHSQNMCKKMLDFLFKCCTKKDATQFKKLHDWLEGNNVFFTDEGTQELGEDLLLCCIETLLDKLRLVSVEDETLWNSIHNLIDMFVQLGLTHDSKQLDPLSRYLQLFDDLSRVMLTLVVNDNMFELPLELFHFQYNYSRCCHLLSIQCYRPLKLHSNSEIYSLFLHAIRISQVHYRLTRLQFQRCPLMYNMVSVRQLWEEVTRHNIHQSKELLKLAMVVCMAEFIPEESPQIDELLDLLSMLTGEQIHRHYLEWRDSPFYVRWLQAISEALNIFKLVLTHLYRDQGPLFNQISTHIFQSLTCQYPAPLPPPPPSIASTLSLLLHDALLFSDSASISILLLVDKWQRSPSLHSCSYMAPVLTALFSSYARFRHSNPAYPVTAFQLLDNMAGHHLEKLDQCLQSAAPATQMEAITHALTALNVLLDTSLRITAASLQPRFSSEKEEVGSAIQQLFETEEVSGFCLKVMDKLQMLIGSLLSQLETLHSVVPSLQKICECLASLVCLTADNIQSPAPLLFECMETLMGNITYEALAESESIHILYLLQLLAASNVNPREVGLMYLRLLPPEDSSSPPPTPLMLGLTSTLPILLKSLPDREADRIFDHFHAVLKKCDLTSGENLLFSQKLVSLLPIITYVISYPNLCIIQKNAPLSHSDLPLFASFHSLTFPQVPRSSLTHFPKHADDFLSSVGRLLCRKGLHLSTQLLIFTALFELALFLPARNMFIPSVIKCTLLSCSYAVAFQLTHPLNDLLQRVGPGTELWTEKKGGTVLDHPAVSHLLEGLKQVLYAPSAGSEQKLLVTECYSSLVFSLKRLGYAEEAISVFKLLLQCVFIKDKEFQEIVSNKIRRILTGIGDSETIGDPKWIDSAFGTIPEFLVHKVFRQEQDHEKLTDYLNALNSAFDMGSIGDLLEYMLSRLIPLILKLPLPDEKKESLLQFISSHTDLSVSDLIQRSLSNIFPDIAVNAPDQLNHRVEFLQRHCSSLSANLKQLGDDITYKLALNISLNPEAINAAFQVFQSLTHSTMDIPMMEKIGSEFLGMLKCLEILNKNSSKEQQLVFVKSLNSLIQRLEARYINLAPHKLMASLTYFLHHQDEEIVKASFDAWESFISHLDVLNSDPIWLHIAVTLHHFVCNEPTGPMLLPMFNTLIANPNLKICTTASYLCAVLPPSADSHEELRDVFQTFRAQTASLSLNTRLEHIRSGLKHQALMVRKLALGALIHLIESERSAISNIILGKPFADKVIASLLQTLVGMFEVKQEEWNLQLARCLGALGPVDPARLNIERERQDTSQLPICFEITSNEKCAIQLLTELSTLLAMTTAQSEKQDTVSLTIQEVMTAYRMSDAESRIRKHVETANPHIWTVIQPYLKSRYVFHEEKHGNVGVGDPILSNTQDPIYMTEKSKTYHHWLSRVCKRLTNYVALQPAILIFQSCNRLVAQINPRIGFMLLPHIIVQIMEDRGFEMTQLLPILELILREFRAVIDVGLAEFDKPSLTHMEATHLKLIIQTILFVLRFFRQLICAEKSNLSQAKLMSLRYLSQNLYSLQLADLSEYCNSYPQALNYLEHHIVEERGGRLDQSLLKRLGRLFQHLGDQDSILGLKALRHHLPELEEAILEKLYEKNLSGVMTLYNEGITREPDNSSLRLRLTETQLDLGFLLDASLQLQQVMKQKPEWKTVFQPLQVEACLKLAQWDELDSSLRTESGSLLDLESTPEYICSARWKLGLGMLLNAAHKRNKAEFVKLLDVLRHQRASFLATQTASSLLSDECYQELVRLCMLHEVEQFANTFLFSRYSEAPPHLIDAQKSLLLSWNDSLGMSKASFKVREPILSLRKGIISLSSLPSLCEEVALCDLNMAKVARKCDLEEPGAAALLKIDHFYPTQLLWLKVNYEKAKFVSKFGEGQLEAVRFLEKILKLADEVSHQVPPATLPEWRHFLSKLNLQHINILIDTPYYDYSTIFNMLTKHLLDFPENENFLFTMAEFCYNMSSEVLKECEKEHDYQLKHSMTIQCITSYFELMLKSNKFMRTSMPKAISLWLEYSVITGPGEGDRVQYHDEVNSRVTEYIHQLQPYHLYCAHSVLISRVCQTDKHTFEIQAKMIIAIMVEYPSLCIWMLMRGAFSEDHKYRERIKSVLNINDFVQLPIDTFNRIQQVRIATESLVKAFLKFPSFGTNERPRKYFVSERLSIWNKDLLNCFSEPSRRYKIVLPIDRCFQLPIDNPLLSYKQLPTIVKFEDSCICIHTKQTPKRLRVVASDGKIYNFLYKCGEDIRRDQCIMEIFRLINLLMKKDPRCSERNLCIRTYSALPFSIKTGLIEWVDGMQGVKNVIQNLYAQADQPFTEQDLGKMLKAKKKDQDRETNLKILRYCEPPVFHKWFYHEFPDPTDWYLARNECTRSAAVMSMVGYLIGLGDRHPENLLISHKTGHIMHVDYGYLFGEGRYLGVPETVPYRLTHNMTDGMGVMNFEGNFRITCEAVLRCTRAEYQTLYPILKNINFDLPHIEGTININKIDRIAAVHLRLKGFAEDKKTILTVEGQVASTITEATNKDKLMDMFTGWSPWF